MVFFVVLVTISPLSVVLGNDCGAQLNAFYKCGKNIFDNRDPSYDEKQMQAHKEANACFENSGCLSPAETIEKQLEQTMEDGKMAKRSNIKECVSDMLLDDLIGGQVEQCVQERYGVALARYKLPPMAQNFRSNGNRSENSSDSQFMIMKMRQRQGSSSRLDIANPLIVAHLISLVHGAACPNEESKAAARSCLEQVAILHSEDRNIDFCLTPIEMTFQKRDNLRSFCLDKRACYNEFPNHICRQAYEYEPMLLCACAQTTMERKSVQKAIMKHVARCMDVSKEELMYDPYKYRDVSQTVVGLVRQVTQEFCSIQRKDLCEESFSNLGRPKWDGSVNYDDVEVDPAKGYALNRISEDAYYIGDGGYQAMFVITKKGVVLVDCPPSMGSGILKAISEVTTEPVTYLIYSHSHIDHIGCAGQFNNIEIIGHELTAQTLKQRKDPNRPVPTRTFDSSDKITIGGKRINLDYHGPNHTPGNIFIYLPDDKILFLVDTIYATWTPYWNLGVAEDVSGYLEAVNIVLDKYDWKVFLGGHLTRAGRREDLEVTREFINDLLSAGKQSMQIMGSAFGSAFQQYPTTNQTWMRFESANSQIASECERIIFEKWGNRTDIRGVEKGAYIYSNCYAITQSMNIDIGQIGAIEELNSGIGYPTVNKQSPVENPSNMGMNAWTGRVNFNDVVVNPAKGYGLNRLSEDVYWIGDGGYQTMFAIIEKGVVLVDCPPSLGPKILQAIAEITSKQVTHLIYSHSHSDHIGCAGQFDNIEIIGHELTAKTLNKRKDPNRPVPTRTFADSTQIILGNKRFNLDYHGPNHTPDNIFIYLPDEKILFLVDTVYATWTPYYNLAIAEDISGFLEAVNILLDKYDWEIYLGGHLTRAGRRQDLEVTRDFINDLLSAGKQALEGAGPIFGEAFQQYPTTNQTWLRFERAFNQIASECERILFEKWANRTDIRGVTEGAFVYSYCYTICTSMNIDIGRIGSIEELNTGIPFKSGN